MKKVAILFMALVGSCALWANGTEIDGIYYILTGNTASVTYTGSSYYDDNTYSGKITIPSSVTFNQQSYSVTSIGDYAFAYCISLSSITIPNSVTSIGEWAFFGCSKLTSVTIPNSVTSIGDRAFYYCSSLSSFNVDAANTHYSSVDGVLFNYAKDTLIQYPIGNTRTSYIIPNSVTSIEYGAFYECTSLSSITIPNSVISIGDEAFEGCKSLPVENNLRYADWYLVGAVDKSLTTYTIKQGTRWIGYNAFVFCDSLQSITIPNSVTCIGKMAFSDCSKLTSITIPNSVTSIGDLAFDDCTSLKSVTIPSSVTSIGLLAFFGCTSLKSITSHATTPPILGTYCFAMVDTSIPLYVPAESITAYQTADQWKDFTNIQAITESALEEVEGQKSKVESQKSKVESRKVMYNGQVMIIKDGQRYTAGGMEVR